LIAVDTNILVYAHFEELPKAQSALNELRRLAEGRARWFLPVFCVGEFLRVITHPRLFTSPYSPADACKALERLLASPSLHVIYPGESFLSLFSEAIRESGVSGNLVYDAQIVALCREAGVSSLLTEDRDFDRFSGFSVSRL